MATARELNLERGDTVRVATPIFEKIEVVGPYCGRPPERKFVGFNYDEGTWVGVLGVDIGGDPRFGRHDRYTRVKYLKDSPDGKRSGDVVELGQNYKEFILPVNKATDSATE